MNPEVVMKREIATSEDIKLLVEAFYGRVRKDEVLGPIFNDIAQVDWEHHLPVMVTFWESLLLKSRSYRRNALQPHLQVFQSVAFRPEQMERWLKLFDETLDDYFVGGNAEKAKSWARGIAHNLQKHIVMQGAVAGLRIQDRGGE